MKTNKILAFVALALGAILAPQAARAAGGDIVDIRAVSDFGHYDTGMYFGERSRATYPDGSVCSPDNPLVAGQTLCLRVRMLVRNADDVADAPDYIMPKTWYFTDLLGAQTIGSGPKLGLLIGNRPVYADYSITGLSPTQFSGELLYDDNGSATTTYRYYTDFYFKYTVQPGDLGLPVRLMTTSFQAPESENADYALWGLNVGPATYLLRNEDGDQAQLHWITEGSQPGWPPGPWSTTVYYNGPIRNVDLSKEGVYFKTVDFEEHNFEGGDWTDGQIWRCVGKGMEEIPPDYPQEPKVSIVGDASQVAASAIAVYIWSEDEDVAYPIGAVEQIDVGGGVKKRVLTVTIAAGQHDSPKFVIAGAASAAVGATTKIYMSTTKGAVYTQAGGDDTTTLARTVKVVEKSNPVVRVYLNGNNATATVTAGPNYTTSAAQLTFRVSPTCDQPITVDLKAAVEASADFGTLAGLYNKNILRITESEGFDIGDAGKITTVTIPANTATVTRYVYAIGADAETESGIRFTLAFETATAPEGVTAGAGATLTVLREGENGIPILDANPSSPGVVQMVKNETKNFRVKFADNYRNYTKGQTDYKGYTFYLVDEGYNEYAKSEPVAPSDSAPGGNQWITFPVKLTDVANGTYELYLYAEAPDGSTTVMLPYTVVLSDTTKKVEVAPYDATTYTVCEGVSLPLRLGLKQSHSGGQRFIFLKGATATDTALVKSDVTPFTTGAYVNLDDQYVSNPQPVQFLDGGAGGTPVTLKAFLANSQTDPADVTTGWQEGQITITVTNKPPQVGSIYVANNYLTASENGKYLDGGIPCDVAQVFRLGTVDEVAADLDATGAGAFQVKWIIDGNEYTTVGNPKNLVVTNTFTSVKDAAVIQVFLKDKDMADFPADPNFRCTARIVSKPYVTISTSAIGGVFNESDAAASSVTITLSEAPTAEVQVKLTMQEAATGYLRLRTAEGSVTNAVDAAGNVQTNVYLVTFPSGVRTRSILVAEMDGTNDTLAGLDLNAEVVTETAVPSNPSETWKDYYTKATPVTLKVANVAPAVIRPNDSETAFTNMNASANTPYTISYGASDVPADLAYVNAAGVAVGVLAEISVDGVTVTNDYLTSSAVRTAQVEFDGEGTHVVVITFTDKDQMSEYRTLYFFVQPSKRLNLSAHGPAPALGTSGGYSQHYASAPGLGAGRVWAGANGPLKVSMFTHSYSFGVVETSVEAWAFGYLADGLYDNGSLTPGSDKGIDKYGNWKKGDAIAAEDHYNYTLQHRFGQAGFDSYVYGWACNNTSSSSGSGDNATTATFVLNVGKVGRTFLPLPETEKDATSYPEQSWEAIFSRELLKSDNCGDINLDGVPDVALARYGLGIIDPNTMTVVSETTDGDLADVSTYNLDANENPRGYTGEKTEGDFLPTTGIAMYGNLIPGLIGTWDEPFTAVLELRGVGVGNGGVSALNDAFAPEFPDGVVNRLAFADVTSDRVYADPTTCPTSTLSYVEWLAWREFAAATWPDEADAASNPAYFSRWSPERPTLPTKVDTDGDGFPDGYEYYYWYRAHVGYLDGGIHKRLTGRRYDPRHPGEGIAILPEEIEAAMDPIVASGSLVQDTDNDGLPDILEMVIGTDPFDFDTDGDGLPDGWELMVAGLNPLLTHTSLAAPADGARNYDGDAMAITSYALEQLEQPKPPEIGHALFTTFAVLDADGDSDGVQWYGLKSADALSLATTTNAATAWSFTAGGRDYVSYDRPLLVGGTLAAPLAKGAFDADGTGHGLFVAGAKSVVTNLEVVVDEGTGEETTNETEVVCRPCLYPVRLPAGTRIAGGSVAEGVAPIVQTVAAAIRETAANALWIYGRGSVTNAFGDVAATAAEYGCLALGRPKAVPRGAFVVAEPNAKRDVAFLHYLVYQEFGFDPRTAWSPNNPLVARWGVTVDDEAVADTAKIYTGIPARTRAYTTYDEFLVYSFFLNNGCDMSGSTYTTSTDAPLLAVTWGSYTTNPQGPNEPDAQELTSASGENALAYYFGRNSENGADTDGDGVPDGWELYVMAGPKPGAGYVFANPYAGFVATAENLVLPKSFFSPFVPAANTTDTSNPNYLGSLGNDNLNQFREFEGTDTMAYYADFSDTIVHPETWNWFNKFLPTNPWARDTDGDGLADNIEGERFKYGTAADDGKLWSIPGGGLNPCSVDTDLDGLPDGWEEQYKGSTVFTTGEPGPTYAKDADGNAIGNPLEGLIDGMDGTVPDAYNIVNGVADVGGGRSTYTVTTPDGRQWSGHVNRDYDRDGLENWQEYMTGTMRCWRYDDPYTPWSVINKENYYSYDPVKGEWTFSPYSRMPGLEGDVTERYDEFWYKTLVDRESGMYNPHLVVDTVPSPYFTRVMNVWDIAYRDDGAYYHFYDRVGQDLIANVWVGSSLAPRRLFPVVMASGSRSAPSKYMGCSPLRYDSDNDGMDDYYELFHGLNPLLGESGVPLTSDGPCDLVYDAWKATSGFEAWGAGGTANYWQLDDDTTSRALARAGEGSTGFDFEVYPWLNGLQQADADGDDLRNVSEAIMPRFADAHWHHTDPSPLWMTDSSYSNSLTRLYYRMPMRTPLAYTDGESFTYGGTTYYFRDFEGWLSDDEGGGAFLPYSPDVWYVAGDEDERYNWMYSFEENEGFDTDHDGTGDYEEMTSQARSATDAQDADSPRRRQAMYFPGTDAALQTMPEEIEAYPVATIGYPDDSSFLHYTVECWVRPERLTDQVILERAIWAGPSNPGDEEFMRKNFQLAIRGGKWYTKYDTAGTLDGHPVEVYSAGAAETGWHHLAARYDGANLSLFVDGVEQPKTASSLAPERGTAALALVREHGRNVGPGDYWFDREYVYKAFVVGASVKGAREAGPEAYLALDASNGAGWGVYKEFFQGYVDEVSVWDGARDVDDIVADYENRVRLTRDEALANQSAFYSKWATGVRRYKADLNGDHTAIVPELRYHWSFDSVPGAENATQVAKAPHGFSAAGKPTLSRPLGYVVDWWQKVVDGYGSVYAGDLDWVTWIPNTVAHLPRFDGTTLDSMFWSANSCGATNGTFAFPRTAEPVSRWSQMRYNGVERPAYYRAPGSRHHFVYEGWSSSNATTRTTQYEFTGRHLNLCGDDLLPLGGAFVKYVDAMWDGQGASSVWEQTGSDANNDGLPDWWEEYADQNYRPADMDPGETITWNTLIARDGETLTAGEAYLRDLALGMYVDAVGKVKIGPTEFAQTAKTDGLIPDWWKSLRKIDNEEPLADTDNDGLNNYVEYLASEVLPFGLQLYPTMARSNVTTLDYFRKVGKLYVGEMLTDHDQMEDHWERSLGDATVADATVWDALKDADEDGWTNFDESRYVGYARSTLAQLASHAVGTAEILDAPIPSVKLLVRYNGSHFKASTGDNSGGGQQQSGGGQQSGGSSSDGGISSVGVSGDGVPNLVVRTFTKEAPAAKDAEFTLRPGETVSKAFYLGGWEDRVVRGTLSPGNIDIGSVNVRFAQMPQSDLYSWTDENGLHLSRPYAEYKAALERNPGIIQNVQGFEWLELVAPVNEYTSANRAVTVTRDALTQKGHIAVYGQRVGTIDLTTGEFEFDLGAMMDLSPNYTYSTSVSGAWSYKEAIFALTYSAKIPSVQTDRFQVSLAAADKGFIRGGKNTIMAFFDNDGNGEYTPGEPFGVLNDVDIGWAGREVEIELSDMSAVTPRVDFWSDASDRAVHVSDGSDAGVTSVTTRETLTSDGTNTVSGYEVVTTRSNALESVVAQAPRTVVSVTRFYIDGYTVNRAGLYGLHNLVMQRTFDSETRSFLHEGDFLRDGNLDIDWQYFNSEVVQSSGVGSLGVDVTNVTYIVTFDWDSASSIDSRDTNATVKTLSTLITRRFERVRTRPTPRPERAVYNQARPTFAWTIDGEDAWASKFGTTYTAFKVRVRDASGGLVYDSGVRLLPPKDASGVYSWTAPICVGAVLPGGATFENLTTYTWEVALYNAKFSTDNQLELGRTGNPFSARETFRMNVTTADTSSRQLAVKVSYAGPAVNLANRVRVQAFTTPDFTGDPVAEATASTAEATVTLVGLAEGDYFLRAYIDTDNDFVRDSWESWGYLNERDRASKAGIFNPVSLTAAFAVNTNNVRTIYIEDCDTDGDWFPDVWEAEQNGNVFDRTKIGPATGDAELIGVNTNLAAVLSKSGQGLAASALMSSMRTTAFAAMVSGRTLSSLATASAGGALALTPEVVPDTVLITSMKVDGDEVVLGVGADVATTADDTLSALYDVRVAVGSTVKVNVYRIGSLAEQWPAEPSWSTTVKVSADAIDQEIRVPIAEGAAGGGFYKVEIEQ